MQGLTLLSLLQLSDTAFPTGSFSHSMSLEAFAEAEELESAEDLQRLVGLHLNSLATSDCVALRASYGAELEELSRIDRLLSATKLTRELRAASSSTGKRFLLSVAALGLQDAKLDAFISAVRAGETPGNLAVGYGVAAPVLGLDLEEVLLAYLYAGAASLVAAGQKLIPLGGSVAQRVLFDLQEEIVRAAEKSREVVPEGMYAFSPTIDVRSMLHERQRVRLYIS
ncbi:MAG TPA: urease accessory UreF family protein [Rubrobacteraceae bacterium]|nr:urease accessory UreF family protein [Rubrobacteraceae bacterium]